MNYKVREMQKADWQRVYEVYRQGMKTGLATFSVEELSYEDFDQERLLVGRLVALHDDKIVGWTTLKEAYPKIPEYKGVAEVSIYIDEDYRGKGTATFLMEQLILLSEEKGFWTLESDIFADNEGSLALHEKSGFRQVGYREKIGKDDSGVWRDTVLMERRSKRVGVE